MTTLVGLTLLSLCCSVVIVALLLAMRTTFGSYTERIERACQLDRQSQELTRQSNASRIEWDGAAIDEQRATVSEMTLKHELALELFAETARRHHELYNAITNQRSA